MSGACVWICGLPGSGRSTVAAAVAAELAAREIAVESLDTAEAAEQLVLSMYRANDVGDTDLERLGYVAALLARNGVVTIVAVDSGKDAARRALAERFAHFVVVYVDTPAELCAERAGGPVVNAAPFEPPVAPDLRVVTHDRSPAATAAQVVSHLESIGLLTS